MPSPANGRRLVPLPPLVRRDGQQHERDNRNPPRPRSEPVSRFRDNYDDDMDEDEGRAWTESWDRKVREAMRSDEGRAHLAAISEALLALPEKRLISGAMCTVGGVDAKLPEIGEEEMAQIAARSAAWCAKAGISLGGSYPQNAAEADEREEQREELAKVVSADGEGVCLIGAYLWHRKVTLDHAGPAEAFADLPALAGAEEEVGDTAGADVGGHVELAAAHDAAVDHALARRGVEAPVGGRQAGVLKRRSEERPVGKECT